MTNDLNPRGTDNSRLTRKAVFEPEIVEVSVRKPDKKLPPRGTAESHLTREANFEPQIIERSVKKSVKTAVPVPRGTGNTLATHQDRGASRRGTGKGSGNFGTFLRTESRDGLLYARYRAEKDTWVSASLVQEGYDKRYGKDVAYGAYLGLVLTPNGKTLKTPDRIIPDQEYLIPIRTETAKVNQTVILDPSSTRVLEIPIELLHELPLSYRTMPTFWDLKKLPTGATAPTVLKESDRRIAITKRKPAVFEIVENPSAGIGYHLGGMIGTYEEVTRHAAIIESEAKRQGLDPDFVKAVVWMESTHTVGVEPFLQTGHFLQKSPRPMNVTASTWGRELGLSKEELADPHINIAVGTFILGEIWKRTRNPTPEKVATLWQNLHATRVSDVGKVVDYYYKTKPWEKGTSTK